MKFKITKASLLEGLQRVQNIVGTRSTLPILANTLVVAEDKKLKFTTTDMDVTISCVVEAEVQKGGSTTLPVKRLSGIVRELPDKNIEFEIDDKDVATLKCESSFFKIIGLKTDEFPPMPKIETKYSYHLDQGVFKEMLRKTSYAASTDETRYVLNGILLNFKGNKLAMVATDGRRLALVEQEVEFPKEAEISVIVPTKAVNELLHTLGDEGELKIRATAMQIIFEFGTVVISSKLIEGTYPNFRQVIPVKCEERITVERESLLTSLRRVALLTNDKSNATKLTFGKNKIVISTITPDVGEARETIPIKYTGKEITVAFNPEFMMDPLRNLSNDEIFVELTDDLSPGVIKCDIPFLYVLMPMRIN
ncbi:MAG: DNA polymerase III subunit beta [Kiritimatiellae bacterium]|nr:DNA polymerase III subunit beta [Kiritimatiellia bacterium]MDD5519218.1 DNA polymerase III subunit beta [Kiritimatiellia bacterium]